MRSDVSNMAACEINLVFDRLWLTHDSVLVEEGSFELIGELMGRWFSMPKLSVRYISSQLFFRTKLTAKTCLHVLMYIT